MNVFSRAMRDERLLWMIAILTSIVLSTWLNVREVVINPDAICYLLSAEKIGNGGLNAAMNLCGQANWPFYSLLIYFLVTLTQFSYPVAAYCVDGVFSMLSVLFFILIVKELGASKRVLWMAAAVILLSHQFNSVREYIIRDHGFWAFYLASIWSLLRYFREPTCTAALSFNASLILASLFRIEGVIFLLTLPHLAWLQGDGSLKRRAKHFFSLQILTCIAVFMLTAWLLVHPQAITTKLGRLPEILNQFQQGLTLMMIKYQTTKSALAQYVLNSDSAKHAGLVLCIVLFTWYFLSIISNLSWPYAFLVVFGFFIKAYRFSYSAYLVLIGYLLVNFLITFCFLLERMFLSKRYLIALSLVLMLFVPFGLDKIISKFFHRNYRALSIILSLAILASALGGIFNFGYSKAYIHEAGDWIAKNVPREATLYVNDYQLMYYSKHFGDDIFIKIKQFAHMSPIEQGDFKHYDYLALRLSKKAGDKALQQLALRSDGQMVQRFCNRRGDQIIIYQIKKPG